MKSKNIFLVMIGVFLLTVLGACGGDNESSNAQGAWKENANLDAEESMDDLYEKAKEEGELVVYAQSSATEQTVNSFKEEYPDINVSVTKVSSVDMLEKIRLENEGDVQGADVVVGKDSNGFWKNELLDNHMLHSYHPNHIADNLISPYDQYKGLPIITEVITVMYNSDANDNPPIESWWDLTTPEWQGRVTMKNPLEAADIQDLFLTMIQHSDEMEADYEETFGEKLELNGTENAGYEFVKRLLDNDVVLMSSMGDSVDAVASSTSSEPPIVIASSVKLRDVESDGLPIQMVHDITPKVSVPGTTSAFIIDGTPNVNSAKLFIQWIAGGDDGTGAGFTPFNNPGTFSTREDIEQDFDVPGLEQLDLWEEDVDYYYQNVNELRDFLIQTL
ncbi:ABC transporter substrate-binding protein [Oceanobacillus indicireducens]|uniref:Iron(III) transport system substrate-binding protein n=1 Tax=Oceanobacillus indicireducens TaxID=1004261 RepID=A0A917Y0G7_9BACI|nr:ABC transporter substrate-binding protein [Oceanobacillus indicireducens]GGN59827.1 hypothetical protein GCM10007971_23330 [Oceanobacillus indicireducens]